MQIGEAFTHETFLEMLDSIKAAVKDEKVYLFMDNAKFHKNPEVK